MTTLDNLRREAKHWLRALQAGDAAARERLRRAYAKAAPAPVLRDVQHALAVERGYESWAALKAGVLLRSAPDAVAAASGGRTHDERVATFLGFACWDHRVNGKGDHRMQDRAAQRLLAQHPELAGDSLPTAVVCGDLEQVRRRLDVNPAAACEPGGARGWTPLLYLCFARFTHPPLIEHALAIGRELLARGANPNDFYMAGEAKYSALVGLAGEGEQDAPRQPQAIALFDLLLEKGAAPFDIQVLYNTHFSADLLWWLELVHARTAARPDWRDPSWSMFGMGGYGPGAHYVLSTAVRKNNLALAEWALTHGASPNDMSSSHPKFKPQMTHVQAALRNGFTEMAELLRRHGAAAAPPPALTDEEQFVAACLSLDRQAVTDWLGRRPEYLRAPAALFAAARRDRADVVSFLLDLGVPVDVEDETRQQALHVAASHNSLQAARVLIDRGAPIDPRETSWHATPIGFAAYGDQMEMVQFLSQYTRNVWTLALRGFPERLRDVLNAEPDLAKARAGDGTTPLFWLPDEEAAALEIADLLLSHGADPSITDKTGRTAADRALTLGMVPVARRLSVFGRSAAPPPDLARYESLARDLLFAFETGQEPALARIREYAGVPAMTWEELRAGVRQRLANTPDDRRPEGYFALPHARLFIAQQAGFDSWTDLVDALAVPGTTANDAPAASEPEAPTGVGSGVGSGFSRTTPPAAAPPPADVPVEMRTPYPVALQDGVYATTTDVWDVLMAARDGDLPRLQAWISRSPSLVHCDYNYTVPLHLAVREGHLAVVQYLLEHGAANPKYETYPYRESLVTMAEDRGDDAIARVLREYLSRPDLPTNIGDSGDIKYGKDDTARRFQKLVNADALSAVEALLHERPELALDETAFWSEGILMMPAKAPSRPMVELLMQFGATVPVLTKWGREYYFKHYDMAAFLLDRGMDPNHRNCHGTMLLHSMGHEGDVRKARLLIDRGADIDVVDREFQSTPLGFAARWGRTDVVALLLEAGADPNLAGAPWATPLEWARKKGHAEVAATLRRAGAK